MFRRKCGRSDWSSEGTSRSFVWGSRSSRVISRYQVQGCHPTAADMASLLLDVCSVAWHLHSVPYVIDGSFRRDFAATVETYQ